AVWEVACRDTQESMSWFRPCEIAHGRPSLAFRLIMCRETAAHYVPARPPGECQFFRTRTSDKWRIKAGAAVLGRRVTCLKTERKRSRICTGNPKRGRKAWAAVARRY